MFDATLVPVRRALISVSDKTGLVDFAHGLDALGIALVSTGGTAAALRQAGVPVTDVSTLTGFPEIMEGRVKTLHPKVHGGLLGRRGTDDAVMAQHDIAPIDLLVTNLYPFEAATARPDCTLADAIENIDIGGPAMLRAAAKNHEHVAVVVDPTDYAEILEALAHGGTSLSLRRRLSAKAYAHTARYDGVIANWLGARPDSERIEPFAPTLHLSFELKQTLRYGENPHQGGALYVEQHVPAGTVASARVLAGKELSYNNIADADAALECVKAFRKTPACVIVKHSNPCGVALGTDLGEAYLALHTLRCRSRATQHRLADGQKLGPDTSIDKVLLASAEQRLFDTARDLLPGVIELDDTEWRTEYLYSRAATIYGGTAEVQRNIIARRLLDLGKE